MIALTGSLLFLMTISIGALGAKEIILTVDESPSKARVAGDKYISWREHIIDDPVTASEAFNGSDGLVMKDLDLDGFEDIVSVHESDGAYDSAEHDPAFKTPLLGHVRIAFGSNDPTNWTNITLAEGSDVASPEDAAIADVNNDGFPDIMIASELGHLIYFQNPTHDIRDSVWPRLILPSTQGRGSYLRTFFADFEDDGRPEATGANKGAQRPGPLDLIKSNPVSVFKMTGDPLIGASWQEQVLGHYSIPQNAETVDLDSDGDPDIVVGSRGEGRILWFENMGQHSGTFAEHAIGIAGAQVSGFNMAYSDINLDGRLDIIADSDNGLVWLEQPQNVDNAWIPHVIGTFIPDSITGIAVADINGDGLTDIMAGSYSRGSRLGEGDVDAKDSLGRLGWFENDGLGNPWKRHDISRRKRGMFDKFIARDLDSDGDIDFIGTRGNSGNLDGVFWLEQIRTEKPTQAFTSARTKDSQSMPLP